MSVVTYNQHNQLPDDVLLMIFYQLVDQDLLRCELVCRQWRNVLQSGRVWKILFRRQIVSSKQWRRVLQNFDVDVDKLETVHYRGLCRTITRQLKEIDRNWRTGKFKEIEEKAINGRQVVTVENGCVFTFRTFEEYFYPKKLFFFDRRNKTEGYITIPFQWSVVTNTKIVVAWDRKTIEVWKTTDGRKICEIKELEEDERISWHLTSCCITGDQMAVLSQNVGQEKLSLWDVSVPSKVTRLKSQFSNLRLNFGFDSSMKMDEEFIFIFISSPYNETRFYFFSKETLELHWQKTVGGNMKKNFAYGNGLLLLYVSKKNDKTEEYWIIQIYDVKSTMIDDDL